MKKLGKYLRVSVWAMGINMVLATVNCVANFRDGDMLGGGLAAFVVLLSAFSVVTSCIWLRRLKQENDTEE